MISEDINLNSKINSLAGMSCNNNYSSNFFLYIDAKKESQYCTAAFKNFFQKKSLHL